MQFRALGQRSGEHRRFIVIGYQEYGNGLHANDPVRGIDAEYARCCNASLHCYRAT
jgi:hypothetical protein